MSGGTELRKERFEAVRLDTSRLARPPWAALAGRFGFGAGIAIVAGLVGMRFGPLLGGLFLAFPAVLPAALSMIERKEGEEKADVDAIGAVLGSGGMLAFALVAALGVPVSAFPALALASAAWIVVAAGLFLLVRQVLRNRS